MIIVTCFEFRRADADVCFGLACDVFRDNGLVNNRFNSALPVKRALLFDAAVALFWLLFLDANDSFVVRVDDIF